MTPSNISKRKKPVSVADSGGWVQWNGGEYPVGYGTRIEIMFRDGDILPAGDGAGLIWSHNGLAGDIVAYRIIDSAIVPLINQSSANGRNT